MSDLSRRPSSRPSRKQRESRAFTLTMATGGFAVATVVLLVLWVAGVSGFGLFFLFALLTAASGYGLRRTMGT